MQRKVKKKSKRRKPQPVGEKKLSTSQKNFYIVLGAIVAYVIVISYLSILRFNACKAGAYDMGIMIQTIWNTSRGWILQESINMGYPMMRFWMAHWEFIFIPVSLFYLIFSSPYTILIIQSIVVASGAIPVYWLARERLHNASFAMSFASLYLLYPALHNANLFDLHGVTFAIPFLMFAFYFLQKRDFGKFAIFGFIALICREDAALILFMMGAYALFFLKERKWSIGTILISLIYFGIWYKRMAIRAALGLPEFVIMEGAPTHWDHLSQVKNDALYAIKFLAKKHNIQYFIDLLGPLGFLSLLNPVVLLIATPTFLINLLSSYHNTHTIEFYYSSTAIPFIFASAIYGSEKLLTWLQKWFKKRATNVKFKNDSLSIISTAMVILTLIFFFWKSNAMDFRKWEITEHQRAIRTIAGKIPDDASVSALNHIVPHVAERHEVYLFNDNVDTVDYIIYDFYAENTRIISRSTFHLPSVWPDNDFIQKVLSDRNYGVVDYEDGVCLWKKGANYDKGLEILAFSAGAEITEPLFEKIENNIFFKGHRLHPIRKICTNLGEWEKGQFEKMIHFTCFWTTEKRINQNYSFIFKIYNKKAEYYIHHSPVLGVYPTQKWTENEIIRDEIFWDVPSDMEKGSYTVAVRFEPIETEREGSEKTASKETTEYNFVTLFTFDFE